MNETIIPCLFVAGPPYKTERSESEDKQNTKTEAATKAALSPSTHNNWPIVNKAEESHGTSHGASKGQSAFSLLFSAVLLLRLL